MTSNLSSERRRHGVARQAAGLGVVQDTFASAFIRARKPPSTNCCGPECGA
ncbi:MAG: hypothetical protein ACRD2I_06625 [Vicinamibacterales bacterium]